MTSRRVSAPGATRNGWVVAGLFLIALVANVTYVVSVDWDPVVSGDAAAYDRLGTDLVEGKGFPIAGGLQPKREPGYPVFLALIYAAAGHDVRAVRLVQAVLVSGLSLLTFALARELRRARLLLPRTPVVAAALAVVYPGFVFYAGVLMREILFTVLTAASLLFLTRHLWTGRAAALTLYGAFVGLGALVDARLMFFPAFFAIIDVATSREWRQAAKRFVIGFGMALLVVFPWTIRNYVVFDRFVLLTTSPYKGLFLVTSPEEFLEWDWEREPLKSLRWLPPDERDAKLAELAVENLRKHPWHYAASLIRRFVRLWSGGHTAVSPFLERSVAAAAAAREWGYVAVKLLFVGVNAVFVLGGAVGAIVYARRLGLRTVLHLVAFVGYLSIMHSLLFATPRYHIPAIPALIVFLAYLVCCVGEARTIRQPATGTAPATEPNYGRQ